jgi:hypothetical protein
MLSDVNVRRITASSEMPDRPSTLVYNSKIGNLSVQVGVPPGVGSGYGHFEVVRGWGLSLLDRWG